MAEALKDALGVEAELISGDRGEFTVRVNGAIVAGKTMDEFPSQEECVRAVQQQLTTEERP